MTPEQAAAARAWLDQIEAAPPPPGHVLDQARAAAIDAHEQAKHLAHWLAAMNPGEEWRAHFGRRDGTGTLPDEVAVLIVVALRGLRQCQHLKRNGPQPAWARLALGRVECGRCLATLRKPPPDEADRCDWCHSRGNTMFRPIAVQTGPLTLAGDACNDCNEVLRVLEREGAK